MKILKYDQVISDEENETSIVEVIPVNEPTLMEKAIQNAIAKSIDTSLKNQINQV